MEMNQAQAVLHVLLLQQIQCFQQLSAGQSELRGVATALFPLATTAGCQLDADTDIGLDTQFLRLLGNDFQFVKLFDDNKDTLAHLLSQQGQLDVRLILITITDNDGIALALYGNDRMQLRLRTGLDTQVELTSVRDNLFYHGLHLVHLNREHNIVLGLILILLGSLLKAAPRLLDTIIEDIGEAQQYRRLHITQCQLVHHVADVNLRIVLTRRHIDVSLFVNAEVAGSPTVDVV